MPRSFCKLILLTFAFIALVTDRSTAQSADAGGKLTIYGMMTQVGIVAKREFLDGQRRVYKTIYYAAPQHTGSPTGPYFEKDLQARSVVVNFYDEFSCVVREERSEPPGRLASTIERKCVFGTAIPEQTIYRNHRGIRERQTTKTGTLHFSSDGKKVVAMNASLPQKTDLVNGWGRKEGGMAIGIAVNQPKGRQQELTIYQTTKNIDRSSDKTIWISPLEYELTHSSGRVIPYRGTLNNRGQKIPNVENCPGMYAISAPRPGTAQSGGPIALLDHYDPLPIGEYRFKMKLCVSGASQPLVSNMITFEVID